MQVRSQLVDMVQTTSRLAKGDLDLVDQTIRGVVDGSMSPDYLNGSAQALHEAQQLSGPLEADIMEDGHTGRPYVLEVNPRYWSSLQLAHRAGADFASTHLAAALGERISTGSQVQEGVWGRALVPFDLLAYLSDSERAAWNPPFWGSGGEKVHDDLLALIDPGPTLGFLLSVGRF